MVPVIMFFRYMKLCIHKLMKNQHIIFIHIYIDLYYCRSVGRMPRTYNINEIHNTHSHMYLLYTKIVVEPKRYKNQQQQEQQQRKKAAVRLPFFFLVCPFSIIHNWVYV